MICPITCYLHYKHACSWIKTISNLYTIPETDFHIFVRGVDKYLGGGGGAAACFGRGVVATPRKAKEKV